MKKFILVVETAPRSLKVKYFICKLDTDVEKDAPVYRVWGVHPYFEEAVERVAELNRAADLAVNSRLDKGGA